MDLSRLQSTSLPLQASVDVDRIAAAGKAARAAAGVEGSLEERRAGLRKAAKEFEAIFVNQMISAMRKTVSEGGLVRKNQGEKIFESMLDEEWSKKLTTKTGHNSLGALLYRQLSRHAGLAEEATGDRDEMMQLTTKRQFVELDREVEFAPDRGVPNRLTGRAQSQETQSQARQSPNTAPGTVDE